MMIRCLSLRYWFATAFNSNKDYYKILNIKQTATAQQIKKSFRTLAKQYHPDADKGNEQKFKQLNQAYQVLSSDVMKKDYDDSRRSQHTHQYSSNSTNRENSYNRYGNSRQQQYNYTYRGYQKDNGWRNRDFRQQTINNIYQRQQEEFYRQANSRYNPQHDENLRKRSSNFRNEYNFNPKQSDMEAEIQEMLRKNEQKIKITRQSVRKAYQEQQRRREKQFQDYKQKRNSNITEDMKSRAYKMAEGIKDNIDGIAKVGKYVKENLDGAIKVGKYAKKLWDQYKKK